MPTASIWPTVHAERQALADDLAALPDARWDTASLCEGWTVRDVLAHMTATARISTASFFPKLVAAGLNLSKMQTKDLDIERGSSPADTLSRFRSIVSSTKHPPGPMATWLGETIVHGDDIRRPLGIIHTPPVDAMVRVADSYKGSNLVMGAKRRIAGVHLRATDADWEHGTGAEVTGPMLALLMAIAGRPAAIDELTGEGVAVLRRQS